MLERGIQGTRGWNVIRWAVCAGLVICCLAGEASAADAMRCGTHLVRVGDTKAKVLRECGEPTYREVISGEDEVLREQWIYEYGRRRFTRILSFRGIRLIAIESEAD